MDNKTRRSYSAEFKREAIVLASRPAQVIPGAAQSAPRRQQRAIPLWSW